ncbi:AAA family ATPase [Streptomyces griseofuscus]|uniref:AAA family ATPase n=1 Tax=Streptomyces griseofuscus TaxID=146922 RepID=UPI0036887771
MTQAVDIRGEAGEPIPHGFKGLSKLDVEFRRSEFSIVAAGPGTGKSLLAAMLATKTNVPTLYFSADSSAATQMARATSMITGDDVKTVKGALLGGDFSAYADVLGARWWTRWNYDARPKPSDIERDLLCFYEVYNTMPHLVVVDNLSNVDTGVVGDAESYTFGLEGLNEYLSEMARVTKAHVLGLHHVNGPYADGLTPIPLSGVKGQISRVPNLVLTIHVEVDETGARVLHMSPVKNREGVADPSGATFASFRLNRTNLRLEEIDEGLPVYV